MAELTYELHGVTTLSAFLGDRVVYRNLEPADTRLQGLQALWPDIGLPAYRIPRKTEPEYAQLLARILRQARALKGGGELAQVLYVGDTEHNDGTAFRNLKAATGWPGYAFIAREKPTQSPETHVDQDWYVANRWSALPAFGAFVRDQGIPVDRNTAVVFDLDKTSIGARGRNDKVIDQARLDGVKQTVAGLLQSRFDERLFVTSYNELNQSQYHAFTSDNQDYLAYICLILGAGLYPLAGLVDAVRANRFGSFQDFIAAIDDRRAELDEVGLLGIHRDVWANVQAGDPTPFKAFRYNEYLTTIARFGDLAQGTAERALRERIVITQEVRDFALAAAEAGAICFGVSDKPDEASVPTAKQREQGLLPLHRLPTLAVGSGAGPSL